MRMLQVQVTDPGGWDRALLALPNPHILQSWAWGQFKSRHGWSAGRFLFEQGGRTVAAASILQRRLPHMPVAALYVPKGPAMDWTNADLAGRVLAELERLAHRRKALFIKIDPEVHYAGATPSFSPCPACGLETARLLTARGWRFSDEQIQLRSTLLLDLLRSEDDLLAAMEQETRDNVRLAERSGVSVRPGSSADVGLFYRLYAETAQRTGLFLRPPDYYRDAWGRFLDEGLAHMLLAEASGAVVAGLILFAFGTRAWYAYGASTKQHRELMPNHLVQREAIRLARSLGCPRCGLRGIPARLVESVPTWEGSRFKLGLGGELARGLGAWDYPASRLGYRLYTAAMTRTLGWRSGRREQPGI